MRYTLFFLLLIFLNNCSLNKDSQFWTEDLVKRNNDQKDLLIILEKSDDITNMTIEEYQIYIDAHTKKSKYPDISK